MEDPHEIRCLVFFSAGKTMPTRSMCRTLSSTTTPPYTGDSGFLADATDRTRALWNEVLAYYKKERDNGGVLDIDSETISTIIAHKPGYIDRDLEQIVGLQTDVPLKRAIMPYGGINMMVKSAAHYGKRVPEDIENIFRHIRKTHNDGVFDAYTPEMRKARKAGIITGLPDGYGRGRIIGDYRRVPLYGVDRLIQDKNEQMHQLELEILIEDGIRAREEINDQIEALEQLKTMASAYGFDISRPAATAQEAVQWLYFAYLGAIKEQNGAAMSLGRVSTFLDIYIQRDLREGKLDELGRAGTDRSLCDEAAHRPLPAHAGIRPTVQRRPGLGHRGHRRHEHGRAHSCDQDQLPLPAHAQYPGPSAGAELDRAVEPQPAQAVQGFLHGPFHPNQFHSV